MCRRLLGPPGLQTVFSICTILSVLFLSALAAGPTVAEVATLTATADNTLYEEFPNNSCGAGGSIIAGRTNNAFLRRALVRFDLSSVPAGSTINSVDVVLDVDRTRDTQSTTMGLHRTLADWGEAASDCTNNEGQGVAAQTGDATWPRRNFDTVSWSSAGGDFNASASATLSVGGRGTYTWTGAGLVNDVQAWVDNPATNFGWTVLGDESADQTTRRFGSKEASLAGDRPQLIVDYTPPSGAEACCTAEGFCSLVAPASCGGTVMPGVLSCNPNPCAQPQGACCLPDESCAVMGQADCAGQGGTFNGEGSSCTPGLCQTGLTPFVDELPIPAIATPTSGASGGEATYSIDMTEFQQQLHRDLPATTLWGYGGTFPGPTIEASSDATVTVDWINNLGRTTHYLPVDQCPHGPNYWQDTARTVVHLHGAHVPARFDGHPELDFMTGEQDTYIYPNTQLPATLWYHDHALGITRLNVYMGLAGFYIIRDPFDTGLGLPAGEFEVPLVIQDRSFNADGSLSYPEGLQQTFYGDYILVNGKVWPFMNVKQGKYRFRLLNGSNSRVYTLSLSNGATFQVIGTEGGLIDAPLTVSEITLAPAERYEVVIDFAGYTAGTEIELRNSAPIRFPNDADPTEGVVPEVMKFIVGSDAGHTAAIPATLRPVTPIPESEAVENRYLVVAQEAEPCAGTEWLIVSKDGLGNELGKHWDDIAEMPELGTTEIWSFDNDSAMMHPMHMHLVMFQILDRSDLVTGDPVPVADYERGWKDTAMAMPGTRTRVIARFEGYVGKYAYHCHILEHEDHEMMRQMRVHYTSCDNDGLCEAGEDCVGCPLDCGVSSGAECGNGLCEIGDGENCLTCPQDCAGNQGGKPADRFCCGTDGGTNPVSCGDARCTTNGFYCRPKARLQACCGDEICEGAEISSGSCAVDCGASCTVTENPEVTCDDGIDNDCDGDVDGADADCATCTVTEDPEASCSDGQDNDCDGQVDCADSDCAADAACGGGNCGNGVCDAGEDCNSCAADCDGVTGGKPANRFCCGDGVQDGPEGDGSICDGNF